MLSDWVSIKNVNETRSIEKVPTNLFAHCGLDFDRCYRTRVMQATVDHDDTYSALRLQMSEFTPISIHRLTDSILPSDFARSRDISRSNGSEGGRRKRERGTSALLEIRRIKNIF